MRPIEISYNEFLTLRVKHIEEAIDHHFDLIKPALRNKRIRKLRKSFEALKMENPDYKDSMFDEQLKSDPELLFTSFNYWTKLNRLIDNESILFKLDKARAENRISI